MGTDRSSWAEPGAHEVAAGVFRIPLPLPNDGLRAVNIYAIVEPEGLTLIDGGWAIPEARDLLAKSLASIGAGLADIREFLVTHVHRDHYTQATAIRKEFGSTVSLGAGEKPTMDYLQDSSRRTLEAEINLLRELGAGVLADEFSAMLASHPESSDVWDAPDRWIEEGVVLAGHRSLEAVHTPGHTAGHLVFHDVAAELLFAGDHVLPTITPSIGFEPVHTPNPLGAFMGSLALLRARPDALLLPAHGPVAPSVHARVDELLEHHRARLDEVLAAAATGATTAHEMAGILKWTRHQRNLADLDPFNAMLATAETAAHLDLLVAQGRMKVSLIDGIRRYTE